MKNPLRSAFSTQGRRMAGARALWVANGMKREMIGKPIIAIANSFTQFVPGHTHLHEIGQLVLGGVYVQRPQGRCAGVHLELRQDYSGYADGRHEAEHPYGVCEWWPDGGWRVEGATPRPD